MFVGQKLVIRTTIDSQKISTGNSTISLIKDKDQTNDKNVTSPQRWTVYEKDEDKFTSTLKTIYKITILHNVIT